jgi:hypothetical protein
MVETGRASYHGSDRYIEDTTHFLNNWNVITMLIVSCPALGHKTGLLMI